MILPPFLFTPLQWQPLKSTFEWLLGYIWEPIRDFTKTNLIEPAIELLVYVPSPKPPNGMIFGRPTNTPWNAVFDGVWTYSIPMGIFLLVVMVMFSYGLGTFGFINKTAQKKRKRSAIGGILAVIGSYWISVILLRFADAFTTAIVAIPIGGGTTEANDTISSILSGMSGIVEGGIAIALLIGLVLIINSWILVAVIILHLIRFVAIIGLTWFMPIVVAIDFAEIPFVSPLARKVYPLYVVMVFLTVPTAVGLKISMLIFSADGLIFPINGFDQALSAFLIMIPFVIGIAAPAYILQNMSGITSGATQMAKGVTNKAIQARAKQKASSASSTGAAAGIAPAGAGGGAPIETKQAETTYDPKGNIKQQKTTVSRRQPQGGQAAGGGGSVPSQRDLDGAVSVQAGVNRLRKMRSGAETAREKSSEARDVAAEKSSEAAEKASETAASARESVSRGIDHAARADSVEEMAAPAVVKGKDTYEEKREALEQTIEAGSQNVSEALEGKKREFTEKKQQLSPRETAHDAKSQATQAAHTTKNIATTFSQFRAEGDPYAAARGEEDQFDIDEDDEWAAESIFGDGEPKPPKHNESSFDRKEIARRYGGGEDLDFSEKHWARAGILDMEDTQVIEPEEDDDEDRKGEFDTETKREAMQMFSTEDTRRDSDIKPGQPMDPQEQARNLIDRYE